VVIFRTGVSDLGLTKVGLEITTLEMGVALVLMALARGVGNGTLSRRTAWLQLAGRCSYEIYLTHMFVVLGLMHPFKYLFGAEPVTAAAYAATYAIMLGLSVLLGYAVERRFSDPLNDALRDNYGGRVARSLESRSA